MGPREPEPDDVEKRNKAIALSVINRILRNADLNYLEKLINVLAEKHPDWFDG